MWNGKNAAEEDQSVQRGVQATAVGLSSLRGVLIQDVARSLDIHPFMLSRWRKESREGKIVTKRVNLEPQRKAELKRLREVERRYTPCAFGSEIAFFPPHKRKVPEIENALDGLSRRISSQESKRVA